MATACREKVAVAYEILHWLVTQPGYIDEGKDLNWLDQQWNGEEDPGHGTGDGGAAAGGTITGQTVPPASELEAGAPAVTGDADGPAPMEENARELSREVAGSDDGSSHSVDSVVDWSPHARCKPGHGAHGLDYDKNLRLTRWEGQNDPTANLESDWKPIGKAYQMRKRQGRTDNLFVFDDGPGSDYGGCDDCLALSVGTMLWHWRLQPKRAIHYSQVCKACTTSTDQQENVANARMRGRVCRMTAPPSADLKARPSRA
eukprot:3336580-Rhodomonas_salina.1